MRLIVLISTLLLTLGCKGTTQETSGYKQSNLLDTTINEFFSGVLSEKKIQKATIVKVRTNIRVIGINAGEDRKISIFKFDKYNKSRLLQFAHKLLLRNNSIDSDFDYEKFSKKPLSEIVSFMDTDTSSDMYQMASILHENLLLKSDPSSPVFLKNGVLFEPKNKSGRIVIYNNDITLAIVLDGKFKDLTEYKKQEFTYSWVKNYIDKGIYPALEDDIKKSGLPLEVIDLSK
ncbi:MAG: hypothetical protein CMP47_13155 [Rickettsiales bacterium]|jgi:hypothetical protein|nr:hypothetical protein [Rickettsiales bacterium]